MTLHQLKLCVDVDRPKPSTSLFDFLPQHRNKGEGIGARCTDYQGAQSFGRRPPFSSSRLLKGT